eukprot:104314_1
MILERQHITKEFDRFSLKKNNKFNIQAEHEQIEDENDDNTFLDSIYIYLQNDNNSVNDIKKLNAFVEQEEYESECIEYDVNIYSTYGNIEQVINTKCKEGVEDFIKSTKISSSSFSIGLRMYYWDYYKDIETVPESEKDVQRDTSGHNVSDLFIIGKYSSFKEEISNYPHFLFKQYSEE